MPCVISVSFSIYDACEMPTSLGTGRETGAVVVASADDEESAADSA